MLYNKWRPAVFADVFGQPHITKTLLAQLKSGRLAHAYLFTGSRGTGKTSCAKILARAINCRRDAGTNGDCGRETWDGEPCNQCESCLAIINGSATDVIEMDAASLTSVDNIRSLKEELVYTPIMCKKRVYIIDEVHMLSINAHNALLKTLEEPPGHALFILATTETHKVPATVRSRCQRFAFRRVPRDIIEERLRVICESEKISAEPGALNLLARMADGSLRDALSLLDQCGGAPLPMAVETAGREFVITEKSVRENLGLTGLSDLADWLMELSDLPKSMARLDALYQGGMDVSAILGQLSALLRDLLMSRMTGDLSLTRLPAGQAETLSAEWPRERILDALSQFAQARLSRSGDKKLEADLCMIRLACIAETENPRLAATAAIGSGASPPAVASGSGVSPPRPAVSTAIDSGVSPPPPPLPPGWDKLSEDKDDPFVRGLLGQTQIGNKDPLEEMAARAGNLYEEE